MSAISDLGDDQLVAEIVAAGSIRRYAKILGYADDKTIRRALERRGIRSRVLEALGRPAQAGVAARDEEILASLVAARSEAGAVLKTVSKMQSGEQKPSTKVNGDKATIVTRPAPKIGDPDEWVRDAGLDPAEWEAYNLKLNTWDAMTSSERGNEVVPMFQVTANCRRKVKLDWLFPAVDVKQRPAPKPRVEKSEPQRVVFFPDQHAPYHDERLHHLAMCHLADWQPHRIVNLGDICDFPTISRHRDNPAYMASATACVDGAMSIINDQRCAAPDADIDLIEGNHDARPRTELLTRAERMYELRPGVLPGDDVPVHPWSLHHLLSLDRFHVNFVGPELDGDNYFQGVLQLAPDIAAVHGFITGTNSAGGTVDRLGQSVFFGHSHRQKIHHVTRYKGKTPVAEWVGVECGTMRSIKGGGGFAFNPNWQQGYATATIWPDGEFTYDMARFDGEKLTWRDRRFR